MKTIIISLNSVIDIHHYFDKFELNKENFVESTEMFAAGKGVNVAKTMNELSLNYKLVTLLGEDNSKLFVDLLSSQNISCTPLFCNGKTRENISVHAKNISETRLCSNIFSATTQNCIDTINKAYDLTEQFDIVVFSGRLPNSVSKSEIVDSLSRFVNKEVFLILDSVSFNLKDYKVLKPFFIKPNEDEILLFGKNKDDSIKNLLENDVKNVLFSNGKDGMYLYNYEKQLHFSVPCVEVLSTVGAGDSSVAGLAAGIMMKYDMEKIISLSASCGTACCMTKGGHSPRREDIEKIFSQISVSNVLF